MATITSDTSVPSIWNSLTSMVDVSDTSYIYWAITGTAMGQGTTTTFKLKYEWTDSSQVPSVTYPKSTETITIQLLTALQSVPPFLCGSETITVGNTNTDIPVTLTATA